MFFQVCAVPNAVHHCKQRIVNQRGENPVPGVSVIVHSLSRTGQKLADSQMVMMNRFLLDCLTDSEGLASAPPE